MNHADGVIEAFPENRNARVTHARVKVQKLGDGLVLFDGHDVGARDHDLRNFRFTEFEHVEQHRPFLVRQGLDVPFSVCFFRRLPDGVFQRFTKAYDAGEAEARRHALNPARRCFRFPRFEPELCRHSFCYYRVHVKERLPASRCPRDKGPARQTEPG